MLLSACGGDPPAPDAARDATRTDAPDAVQDLACRDACPSDIVGDGREAEASDIVCNPGQDDCPGGVCWNFEWLGPTCTSWCPSGEACPPGWSCVQKDLEIFVCVPREDWLCRECSSEATCRTTDARCRVLGNDGNASCTWTCSTHDDCPAGTLCQAVGAESVCVPVRGGCCEGLLCPGVVTCEPGTGCAIATDWIDFKAAIYPFDGPTDVLSFYGYGAPALRSANLDPALTSSDTATFVWYREPGGARFLVVVFDTLTDSTGGTVLVNLDAVPGWDVAFLDDPDDRVDVQPGTGDRWVSLLWPHGETDGFVLGPVPPGAACLRLSAWTLSHVTHFAFVSGAGLETFSTEDGYQPPLTFCPVE